MANNDRVVRAALDDPWAITEAGLELVLSVAMRETDVSIEALEAYRAQHVRTAERLTKRGSVAILEARGPMFRHANIFTAVSGATSYDVLRRDLQTALDDVSVRAIVMSYDTPGGHVTGVDELAKAIRAGKSKKPIVAYVGGSAASAGYWLTSQSTEIVIAETAVLGSIGVMATLQDTSEADAKAGRLTFISSQSPDKRPDLSTDAGRARVQRLVDALAEVFISTVASGRGVKPGDVTAKFGGGDLLVGTAAVAAGMADRIGSFEGLVAELAAGKPSYLPPSKTKTARTSENDIVVVAKADHDAAVATARSEGEKAGASTERKRIGDILALDETNGREASARHLALTTDLTAEQAKGTLASIPKAGALTAEQIAYAERMSRGPRSRDAPGGLVTAEAVTAFREGEHPTVDLANNLAVASAIVAADPTDLVSARTDRKAMWGGITRKLNGGATSV